MVIHACHLCLEPYLEQTSLRNHRYATNSNSCRERDYSKAKSRSHLDKDDKCERCDQPGGVSANSPTTVIKCALCGIMLHKSCHPGWTDELCEGSWLCSSCHVNEKAWCRQRNSTTTTRQTECSALPERPQPRPRGKPNLQRRLASRSSECIDLSSDTETEDFNFRGP